MSEDHGKTSLPLPLHAIQLKNEKEKRKQSAACERTTTSMSNTFRVFLDVPNAAKGLSTWGTQQDIETRVMFMCIANRPKSKPPQLPTSTSISNSISTSTLRCSELLFGRSVVRLATASRRSVQAEVLIHFLLLFHKYVFYSRGTTAPQFGQHFGQHFRHSQRGNLHT